KMQLPVGLFQLLSQRLSLLTLLFQLRRLGLEQGGILLERSIEPRQVLGVGFDAASRGLLESDAAAVGDPVFLGPFSLREVARDLGETDDRAGRVVQRGDDDVGPEKRAVLSDAPALVLEAPLDPRHSQLVAGLVRVKIGLRIKNGKVATDDLLALVSFES